MYIEYNNVKYSCTCRPSATMVYYGLPDDFPVPIKGTITLYANDGFILRKDNTADYLRQTFENGVLTLTNVPEVTEEDETVDYTETPTPTLKERVAILEASTAVLEDALCDIDAVLCELNS